MSKAVAKKTEETGSVVEVKASTLAPTAASEAAALIGLIERAAADPNVDIERVERMYAMYEKAAARNAKAAYDAALAEMQPKLPVIEKKGRIKHGEKEIASYALWEHIAEPVTKITAAHGFALTFRTKENGNRMEVTAILSHKDGHREETSFPFPIDTTGGKNAVQAVGSTTSYGKRYTACSLLNIITKGEDNDGKDAGPETITEEQEAEIRDLIEARQAEIPKFCAYFKIEKLGDLKASDFQRAMTALKKRGPANG